MYFRRERNLLRANSRNSVDDTNTPVDPTVDLKISLDFGRSKL